LGQDEALGELALKAQLRFKRGAHHIRHLCNTTGPPPTPRQTGMHTVIARPEHAFQ
jgi:hypothetical protein